MSKRVAANRTGVADMPGQNEPWASLRAWSSARGNGAAATAERCPGYEGVPPPGPDPSQPDLRRADQLCVVSAGSPISCTRRAVGAGRGSLGQAGGGRRRGTGTSRRRWGGGVIIEQGSSPDQARQLNHLPAGRSFVEGRGASRPGDLLPRGSSRGTHSNGAVWCIMV